MIFYIQFFNKIIVIAFTFLLTDWYAYNGFDALLDVINQFSSVDDESKLFTCDVPQFLQLKRCLRKDDAVSAVASDSIFTDLRFCVDSLMIKLYHLRRDSGLLKPVAKLNMQFICSTSLIDEKPQSFYLNFSSLTLSSMLNSVMLARCTCNSTSSVLAICLSKSDRGENEICIFLPSLDFWLHFSNWTEIIDLCNSFPLKTKKVAPSNLSSKSSAMTKVDPIENWRITASQSASPNSRRPASYVVENMRQDDNVLIVRSDNLGISIHFPVWISEVAVTENGVAEIQEEKPQKDSSGIDVGKHSKYIKITAQSKNSELHIVGRNVKLKVFLEKTSGTLETYEETSVNSFPLFQIFQANLEAEICGDQTQLMDANVYVQCDRLDAWLSHQILYFWHGVVFDIPTAGSSQLSLPSIYFKLQLRKVSLLISDGRVCFPFLLHTIRSSHTFLII